MAFANCFLTLGKSTAEFIVARLTCETVEREAPDGFALMSALEDTFPIDRNGGVAAVSTLLGWNPKAGNMRLDVHASAPNFNYRVESRVDAETLGPMH